MMKKPKIIIVGGGVAGLMAAIKVAEAGWPVQLFSLVPFRRSNSVLAREGISAALDATGEGDSPEAHFEETIAAGDFLANQELPRQMCFKAPEIISLFDRMGVAFNRTDEGFIDFRRLGGSQYHRTAMAGVATGQQLLYALDDQVRRFEAAGLVERFEGWEFLSVVAGHTVAGHTVASRDICRGIVAFNLSSMEIKAFPGNAVVFCTGGLGSIFGRSANSVICTGSAASVLYQQGAFYANGEFVQVYPTAMPGKDKLRLISESVRNSGGRFWVYRDGKPWYFLEERHPKNPVPPNLVSLAIRKVTDELGLGIDGGPSVYLDISHLPENIHASLGETIEAYKKFTGEDPRHVPMKVMPAVCYSMGGLWVDDNQMTSIPGVLAAGECDYQYHGADCLGGNLLLSSVYGGIQAGAAAIRYSKGIERGALDADPALLSAEVKKQWGRNQEIIGRSGKENPHRLYQELGEWMTENVTVVRTNDKLKKTDEKIRELQQRMKKISLTDRGNWMNRELVFVRQLHDMLELARVITLGALLRNESRGAHYKPEFPDRDDKNFLKTTKASWTPNGPKIEYEDVNLKYLKPVKSPPTPLFQRGAILSPPL